MAEEWQPTLNKDLTPFNISHGLKKKAWWQCRYNEEHIWKATINNRVAIQGVLYVRKNIYSKHCRYSWGCDIT
ncbi:zinc-ribbon domain-containing protein [Peribacillus frigoritolerans]|uniref:zinc-ribbon domain-containing protein n=1 Tax=Peribacillus frigoritolerans TaxID=450367 RepID=UPI003D31B814